MRYTIIIEKAEKNFAAYAPDLPGCVSTGKTIDETIENMKEAMRGHIQVLQELGEEVPAPSQSVEVDIAV